MTDHPASDYNDEIEIDFGKYIETLVRQWQWIVACALGLGILALAFSMYNNSVSPSYEAVALIASTKTMSSVSFGSAIKSVSEANLALESNANAQLIDRKTRLQSFVALVQNGSVAEKVLAEIGPKLKENERTTTVLLGMVNAKLVAASDTIAISVQYSDPVIAAEIANAWGAAYVEQINSLYGGSSSSASYLATQAQVTQAKTVYEKAQTALADFIAHNKIDENTRQVEEIKIIVTSLRGARSDMGKQQVQDRVARLDRAYSDSRQVGLFLGNAVSMRQAVSAGGEPAASSNALALAMLKTQIYAAFPGTNTMQVQNQPETLGNNIIWAFQGTGTVNVQNLPETLGSSISNVNAAGMVADLQALISTLETRQTELNKLIDTLSSEIQNGEDLKSLVFNTPIEQKIVENEQKIRDLNSLISTETSALGDLIRARDLAWQSYSALAAKETEMSVMTQTSNSEVAFASPATPPDKKVVSSTKNGAIATGVGLLIGVFVAYAFEFWQNRKGSQPEIISRKMFAYVKSFAYKTPIKSRQSK